MNRSLANRPAAGSLQRTLVAAVLATAGTPLAVAAEEAAPPAAAPNPPAMTMESAAAEAPRPIAAPRDAALEREAAETAAARKAAADSSATAQPIALFQRTEPVLPTPAEPVRYQGPAARGGQAEVGIGDVQITGDDISTDPTTGMITVTGNPRAARGQDEIRATRFVYNPKAMQLVAEGDVRIRQADQEFTATRLTYDFGTRTGQAENIKTKFKTYFLDTDRILLKPGPVYEAQKSRLTTCDREHRHYQVYSRVVDVVPNEHVEVRGGAIDLLGVRLLTIPKVRRPIGDNADENDGRSLLPSFGFNTRNGPYVRDSFDLRTKHPAWVTADVQLNTFREPMGGIHASTAGRLQFVASLFYRDEAENQRARQMQVSRLPEIGVVWRPSGAPKPGRFLSHQVPGVRYPDDLRTSSKWRFSAQATVGYFRQHRGDTVTQDDSRSKSEGRLSVQAQAVVPRPHLGPITLNDLRLMVRQNFYANGDSHLIFGTGIGKKWKIGNWRVGVDRFDQFTSGRTPFLFDDVELRHEWRPEIKFETRGFNATYFVRLTDEGRIFDQFISVGKLFHCLEPRLTYRFRRQEIFFELRIPGFSGRTAAPAGEPRGNDDEIEDFGGSTRLSRGR